MSEPTILMVSPIDALAVPPGAVQIDADCGHRAWLSKSGLAMKLGGGVITRCEDCVDPGDITEVRPVPGSQQELNAILGVGEADQLLAAVAHDPKAMVRTLQGSNKRRRRR